MKRKIKRIAILTGGGDVPGLNAAMRQVVDRARKADIEVLGFRRGWSGLANYRIDGDPEWKSGKRTCPSTCAKRASSIPPTSPTQ